MDRFQCLIRLAGVRRVGSAFNSLNMSLEIHCHEKFESTSGREATIDEKP